MPERFFPIVGIGASAGGLEAVTDLLKNLPPDSGLALVVVQHLDPTHKSALTALLSKITRMPVSEARHDIRLEPNNVYVIPPNKQIGISDRHLKLSPRRAAREIHMSVDHFLRSLAEEEGVRSIGVILSGNGSDGTQGLLAIKAAGGITFAQDEKTAKYPAMPASAISAGCVDFILPPDKIARELARIAGHPYIAPGVGEEIEANVPAEDRLWEEIFAILRTRVGVDFTQYKRATLQRRIHRRMVLQKLESLKGYVAYLRGHAAEVQELFNDILIHVTGFFRDPRVFQTLKRKLTPKLLKHKGAEEAIRIWVPGCSTGEEVYSIAMALAEFLEDDKRHHPVQIFGTDINLNALDKARTGIYPENSLADVPAERLRRFFVKVEGGYRINKAIREMCVFARQNVVTDPPFSNLDLISCRNVLIYLGPALQKKVMPIFHYALKPHGVLLLGASETVGGFADLFRLVDKKCKIYAKKAVSIPPVVTFAHGLVEPKTGQGAGPKPSAPIEASVIDAQRQADRIVLTHYSPDGVVINRNLEVVQFRGRTGVFLEHVHGEASLNLLKMAREGLAMDLRAAVQRAIKQNVRVQKEGVRVKQDGHFQEVTLEVIPFPVPPSNERYYLVLFEQAKPSSTAQTPAPRLPSKRLRDRHDRALQREIGRLTEELAATRESLQAIIEEQEATNEELRSANEEIMSSNEELQSTNEELETAKEELQSTNEELTTLNEELENRASELDRANNDLRNLLSSVHIAIVIVGPDLRIRRFTNVAERLLNLIPADVGRPITDINLPVQVTNLSKLIAEVLDTLATKEVELRCKDGRWYSLRIRPYKTADNKIDGAVVALVDIDALKSGIDRGEHHRAMAEALTEATRQPLLVLDAKRHITSVNEAFCRAFHVSREKVLERPLDELAEGRWNEPRLRHLLDNLLSRSPAVQDYDLELNLPRLGARKLRLNARRLSGDDDKTHAVVLAMEDVTSRAS